MADLIENIDLLSEANQASVVLFFYAGSLAFFILVLSIIIPDPNYKAWPVGVLFGITIGFIILARAWPRLRPILARRPLTARLADSLSRVVGNAVSLLVVLVLLGVTLTILAVYRRATTIEPLSPYTWQPMLSSQKSAIAATVKQFPNHRVLVVRPDTPDGEALADGFADIFGGASELIAPHTRSGRA